MSSGADPKAGLDAGRVISMGSFVCRFCNGNAWGDNGFMSLEIQLGNRKIIVYVCPDCFSHLAGSTVFRCRYCGNIWLQKNTGTGRDLRTVGQCSLCKGDALEDNVGAGGHRGR